MALIDPCGNLRQWHLTSGYSMDRMRSCWLFVTAMWARCGQAYEPVRDIALDPTPRKWHAAWSVPPP